MLSKLASGVARLGRAVSVVFGLALVVGAAGAAFGANGDFFKMGRGEPLAVDSSGKVANLNADRLDGHNGPLWEVVNSGGTLARSNGATTFALFVTPATGDYKIVFNRDVSKCAYTATLGSSTSAFTANGTVQATKSNTSNNTV